MSPPHHHPHPHQQYHHHHQYPRHYHYYHFIIIIPSIPVGSADFMLSITPRYWNLLSVLFCDYKTVYVYSLDMPVFSVDFIPVARSCARGMIHNKIHLIRPGYPRPSVALQRRIVA